MSKKYSLEDFQNIKVNKRKKHKKKKNKYQRYKFKVNKNILDDIIDGVDLSVDSNVDVSINDETVSKLIKAGQIISSSIRGIKSIIK